MTRPIECVEELCDGRVFFIMTRENRARPDNLTRLTDAERAELYNTMVAYAGTYTFNGAVAHVLELPAAR